MSCQHVNIKIYFHNLQVFNQGVTVHTCDPLHPRGLVDAQVVVEDAEDVSQDDAEMFRRHHGAALSVWRRVFWTFLPPVGQIVTQHGEDDLDDLHRSKRIKHTSTEWKQSGLNM